MRANSECHVGLFETYRYKRTGQVFVWNYIGKLFFLNISIIIVDVNTVKTTLCSEISPEDFDLFFSRFFFQKIDITFCETTDTAYSYIKQMVKFSEIKVSVDAYNGLTKNCFRILVLCRGTE